MGRFNGKTCRMGTMFLLTFAFFLLEVIFGYISHSMALIADSFHMLSDVLALVVAFACMKMSKRRFSPKNTFGWVRAEVLGALINTVFLVALSFSIILESIQRFFAPERILEPVNVLIVGALGLGVNIIGLFLFHGHGGHGHSHGGGGGGHGHSHGGGGKAKDHGHSHGAKEGHGHSHGANGGGHGHSHGGTPPASRSPATTNRVLDDNCNDDDDVFASNTVVEPEPELDPQMKAAVKRFRRQSSKYYIPGEELAQNAIGASPDDAKSKKKDAGNQMNMHGIWLHVMGDAFGSLVVIVNALVNWQVKSVPFLLDYLDPILSLMMSALIMGSSIPLLKESAMILLQTVPTHINVQEIRERLLAQFGQTVVDMHEFHIWRLSGNKIVATAHIRCRGDLDDYMRLAEKLKEFFHDEGIHSTTIQPELVRGRPLDLKTCALKCPKKTSGERERECADEACCVIPQTPAIEVVTTNPFSTRVSTNRFSFPGTPPPTIHEEPDHDHNHSHQNPAYDHDHDHAHDHGHDHGHDHSHDHGHNHDHDHDHDHDHVHDPEHAHDHNHDHDHQSENHI